MGLRFLNARYALVTMGFMLLVAGSIGFAYNYLSQSGFEAGTIGTVMSIVSLAGVLIGPAVGDLVDRSDAITQRGFISASMLVCAALAALLLLIPAGSPLILPVIVIAFAASMVGMPLLNGMAFIYERAGASINYGLCRGLGSAAYAIGSAAVGQLWGRLGRDTLPLWVIAGSLVTLAAINLMPRAPRQAEAPAAETDAARAAGPAGAADEPVSLLQFFGTYPLTTVVIASLVLLYFCHNVFQTYCGAVLAEFVPQDQVESVQGTALFIQAMVELPTMFGFALIMRHLSIPRILGLSAIFYSIKHVVLAMATSVPVFYAGMVLQMLSFASLTPAVVYLANELVAEGDRNKGQAVFMTASSVGGLLASFVGGWLFELLSVRAGLMVAVAASVVGTVLMLVGMRRIEQG